MNSKIAAGLLLIWQVVCSAHVHAGGIAAVLTRDGGAYAEVFSAFEAAYGKKVEHFDIASGKVELNSSVSTVVAFGGKASGPKYENQLNRIRCMVPGQESLGTDRWITISMLPDLRETLAVIKSVQPSLNHLTVFWTTADFEINIKLMREEGERLGIAITAVRVRGSEFLPDALRSARKNMDAFWIPPDPLLATQENIHLLHEFSWDNRIPFYGSSQGMAREGAVASIATSFSDIGNMAAKAAASLEAGETLPDIMYIKNVHIMLNAAAAEKCKLSLPENIRRRATAILP